MAGSSTAHRPVRVVLRRMVDRRFTAMSSRRDLR